MGVRQNLKNALSSDYIFGLQKFYGKISTKIFAYLVEWG